MNRCHHLSLLNGGYAVLGIKDHDLCSLDARKARERGLAGVAARRCQDHDLLAGSVLGCRRRHQIGQNRERHIFERDRRAVEQFQIPGISGLFQRDDLIRIELAVIGAFNARLELLICVVRKKKAHDFISHALVIHCRKHFQSRIQRRNRCGNIEASVFGESAKDRLRGCNGLTF